MSQASDRHDDRLFEELHDLLLRRQTGEINPDEVAQLHDLLRGDLFARRLYVQYVYESVGIAAQLQNSPSALDASPREAADHVVKRNTTSPWAIAMMSLARLRQGITQPTPLSLTVAAMVMGGVITAMAFIAPPVYRAFTGRPAVPIIEPAPEVVARITGMHRVVWSDRQLASPRGASLSAGHRVEIDAGLLELEFGDGAVAVLEGPTLCIVESRNKLTLQRGTLLATVPKSAIGFEVATPALKVVDLGTEFGIQVSADRSGEVHVLKGRVQLQFPLAPQVDGQILTAGQAWRFYANGQKGSMAKCDAQRFALSLPKPQIATFQAGRILPDNGAPFEGVEDVMLIEWGRDANFGERPDFDVGQHSGQRANTLLRFDLSTLRGKVDRIVSVTLRITPNGEVAYFPWGGAGQIELYRVSDANARWREGAHAGGARPGAAEGEATWNRLAHATTNWNGSPGLSTAGADHDKSPLAAALYAPRTEFPLEFHLQGDLEFIHGWIDGQPNGGFLLKETTGAGENRICFHSSESEDARARPQLIIQYMPRRASTASAFPPSHD